MRRLLLVFLLLCLPALAQAGDTTKKLCRKGAHAGEACSADGDCTAGGEGGYCSVMAHQRVCSFSRYCAISTTVQCEDNQGCPGYAALVTGVGSANGADYCPTANNYTGDGRLSVECTTDANCKTCVGGLYKGNACSSDSHCTDSTCGAGGTGTCINGIQQSQVYGFQNIGGLSNDMVADYMIGGMTTEDAPNTYTSATTLIGPSSVFYDLVTGDLLVHDISRVLIYDSIAGQNQAASAVLGQPDFSHNFDERMPGDITQGQMGNFTTRRNLGWTYWGGAAAWHGQTPGTYVQDRYRLRIFPEAPITNDANTLILGTGAVGSIDGNGTTTFGMSDNVRGPALMDRCVGGADIGEPCLVDGDCASSTCETTICTADSNANASRVICWRDASALTNGDAPNLVLGQADTNPAGDLCNRSALPTTPTANTLCFPNGVAFDPATGDIWVADSANHRVVMYPANITTGGNATLVLGQATLILNTLAAPSSSTLNYPSAIAFSETGKLAVADTANNRILTWSVVPTLSNTPANAVLGQSTFATNGASLSLGSELCSGLNQPTGVSWDSNDFLYIADYNNSRVYRNITPMVSGSGSGSAVAYLLGQPSCITRNGISDSAHLSLYSGGIAETSGGLIALTDSYSSRVLIYTSAIAARTGEAAASNVLGQSNFADNLSNRGLTAPTASTLSIPTGAAWNGNTADGAPARLYISDSNNNRVLGFNGSSWSNGQAANIVFGQGGSFTTATINNGGVSANSLYDPRGLTTDDHGNLWVADYRNGRVLLFCMAPNTVPIFISKICLAGNSGDTTADLVLGKDNFTTTPGCTCSPSGSGVNYACTTTTAATLCGPTDVEADASTPSDIKVFVADSADGGLGGQGNRSGRVVVYQPGSWSDGVSGSLILGSRPISGETNTSYSFIGRGACELAGSMQGFECAYQEPEGAAAGTGGKICVGGTNALTTSCTLDAQCPGGTCGCPSSGICTTRRTIGDVTGLAWDSDNDILYVGRYRGVLQFLAPIVSNAPASKIGLMRFPHGFWRDGGSFVENEFDNLSFLAELDLDSAGSLYVAVGPHYGHGVLVFNDPAPALSTATPTITRTRTPTNTPTNTRTATNTAVPTVTSGGPATATPTSTPTPTITGTPTSTPTPTPTFTPTATNTSTPTGNTPTQTATAPPQSATPTATTKSAICTGAGSVFLKAASSCTKVDREYDEWGEQNVRCPKDSMAEIFVRFPITRKVPATVRFRMYGHAAITGQSSRWDISDVVLARNPSTSYDVTTTALNFGASVFLPHDNVADNAPAESNGVPITLRNASTGDACLDDDCKGAVGIVGVKRLTVFADPAIPVDLEMFCLEW